MGPTTARIFVLGAALLLGCPTQEPAGHEQGASSGGGSETTSSATSSSGTTEDGSTGETTRTDGTTATSSPLSTTAADEGSTSGSGSGTSDASDTSETSGTTGEPTSACQQGCAVEVSCTMDWPSEDECTSACEANLVRAAAFEPTCADAWETLSECLGTLTCEEFLEWRMPTMIPYPCIEADEGLQLECKGQ